MLLNPVMVYKEERYIATNKQPAQTFSDERTGPTATNHYDAEVLGHVVQ